MELMQLDTPHVSARLTERNAEELLNEVFKTFFTGVAHKTLTGDVTFPLVDLLFNQATLPPPQANPQVHTVLVKLTRREQWFACGNLSVWESELSNPASGVNYGYAQGRVEESISGRLCRRIDGLDIRWQLGGDGLLEQTYDGVNWNTIRDFPGASAIQWIKSAPTIFVEQVKIGEAWVDVREVVTTSPLWDGAKKLVTSFATFSIYVRVKTDGSADTASDQLCRSVADNVKEIFEDADVRVAMAGKGMRHTRIITGPTDMAGNALRIRHMGLETQLRYFLPRLQ